MTDKSEHESLSERKKKVIGLAMDHHDATQGEIGEKVGMDHSDVGEILREYYPEHPSVGTYGKHVPPKTRSKVRSLLEQEPSLSTKEIADRCDVSRDFVRNENLKLQEGGYD